MIEASVTLFGHLFLCFISITNKWLYILPAGNGKSINQDSLTLVVWLPLELVSGSGLGKVKVISKRQNEATCSVIVL